MHYYGNYGIIFIAYLFSIFTYLYHAHFAYPTFDGSQDKYAAWKHVARMYSVTVLNTPRHVIIMSLLTYLNEGTAAMWAKSYLKEMAPDINDWSHVTLKTFWNAMDKAFVNPNEWRNAQDELERLRQMREMTTELYFFKFEQLAKQANYNQEHNGYLVSLLKCNLNSSLMDWVYMLNPFPTSFAEWKRAVITLDQLWRRREE
jgi:hypothetical protein